MPRPEFVVRFSETSDAYLISYTGEPTFENCTWGSVGNAMLFATLQAAQNFATSINSGTVGTTKPS